MAHFADGGIDLIQCYGLAIRCLNALDCEVVCTGNRSDGVCCGGCLNLRTPGADGHLQPTSAWQDGDGLALTVLGRADDGEPDRPAEAVEQIAAFRLGGEMIHDDVERRSPGLHLNPGLGVRAQEIGHEQHDVVWSGVVRGVPVLADDGGEAISVFKHRRLGFSRDVLWVDHEETFASCVGTT